MLWGVYWLPVRTLNNFGITGTWVALLFAVTGLVASLPFLFKGSHGKIGWQHLLGALNIGVAFTLYAIAISYSEVVRVVLLFYLAPVWSMLIECVFFGRRFSYRIALSLFFSFFGIVIIFRGELPLEGLGALGDWMAFFAGLCWSIGSALMFMSKQISVPAMTSASFAGALVVAAIMVLAFDTSTPYVLATIQNNSLKLLVVFALLGLFYLAPVTALTLWGATQIPPAMMSFILTLEVISAVSSSAFLIGERFGLPELLGTVLIIMGALVEIVRRR